METRIKNLRKDNNLTQKQLSKFLNISQVAYSYYEYLSILTDIL